MDEAGTYVEFKYLRCVLDESGTDEAEYSRKAASGMSVSGVNRSLVNGRGLQLECARVLHKILLVPFLMYGSETMIWKKEEGYRVRAVQTDKIRSSLNNRRMDSPECTDKGVVQNGKKGE